MMNDNNGGLLLAGNMIAGPRLFLMEQAQPHY